MLPLAGLLDGVQSALNPKGPVADDIAALSWVLFAGATTIFALVLGFLTLALTGRPSRRRWLASGRFISIAGALVPLVVLTVLLVHTFLAAPHAAGAHDAPLRIEVTGEQWWWRVHYLDATGQRDFATANEIRIPVGRPVELSLRTADVIHSFWVPALGPKLDMIPGRVNRLVVSASEPGEFRGQCAEYCGGPHARMALFVVALAPAAYEAWHAEQRQPSAASAAASHGERAFAGHGCGSCHAIRGTRHAGTLGPDLTHVASRRSLGAGTLPAGAAHLATWIAASQRIKPGNLMPAFDTIPPADLAAIAAYLEGRS